MTKYQYEQNKLWFQARPAIYKLLAISIKSLTGLVYALYSIACLYLLLFRRADFPRFIIVPAFVYITGSIIRARINAPRPYEVFETAPLVSKNTKGKSFPSRHVFCSAVICMAYATLSPAAGVFLGIVTLIIALTRVLAGVHWPKDVLAGLLYGGILGYIGFFLIP